jgi:hypothetical protein
MAHITIASERLVLGICVMSEEGGHLITLFKGLSGWELSPGATCVWSEYSRIKQHMVRCGSSNVSLQSNMSVASVFPKQCSIPNLDHACDASPPKARRDTTHTSLTKATCVWRVASCATGCLACPRLPLSPSPSRNDQAKSHKAGLAIAMGRKTDFMDRATTSHFRPAPCHEGTDSRPSCSPHPRL